MNFDDFDFENSKRSLEDIIFDERSELYDVPTYRNEDCFLRYCKALDIACRFKEKGFLDFTFDTPNKPYFITSLYITWSDDYAEPDKDLLSKMISISDSVLIDGSTWMVSFELYKPVGGKNNGIH